MNVLILTPEFPPFSLGGVSVHASQIANMICSHSSDNRAVVITLINDKDREDIELERNENREIVRVNIYGKVNCNNEEEQFILQNELIKDGIKFAKEHGMLIDIDLIAVHGNFVAEAAIYSKTLLSVPLIYHAHTTYSFETIDKNGDISSSIITSYEYLLCEKSTHIIVVSEYLKKLLIDYFNTDGNKISIIGKGVDIHSYDVATVGNHNEFKVLYVGRISKEKGIDVLLMAFRLFSRKYNVDSKLIIVGAALDNMFLKEIKQKVSRLSLSDKVVFLGGKTQSEIINIYKSCDLVVVPSYIETFGRVAIEAMASKIPVAVSNVGGLGPLVENMQTGFKFSVGSYTELMHIIELVYNGDVCIENIVKNAYEYVRENFSIDKIFLDTMKVYNEILSERTSNENFGDISAS